MSTSSNEGVKSKEKATPLEDEEETETPQVDASVEGNKQREVSKKSKLLDYYNRLLSTTPGAKDVLITILQNQLKTMKNQYQAALDEQQDIKKKYAKIVKRLSKEQVPQVELTEKAKATSNSFHLDNLRKEMSNRLKSTKTKPKKCCKYLYQALGVELPEKKLNKKVPKSERKSSQAYTDDKESAEEKIEEDRPRRSVDLKQKIKEQKWGEVSKTIHPQNETLESFDLQKELSFQVAMMKEQEKDINDLQDKLKKLCQSLEGIERSRTSANKPQSMDSPMKIKPAAYQWSVEDFKLLNGSPETGSKEKNTWMKPESTEMKRATSQESRKKPKPQQKELDEGKCCNRIECTTSKATRPSKTPTEQTKSMAYCYGRRRKSNGKGGKAPKTIPCCDKTNSDKYTTSLSVAPPGKEAEQSEEIIKQTKSTTIDEEALKNPTPVWDKKEKKKSRRSSWKKSKSHESLSEESEEHCDCGIGNCPMKKGKEESTCCDFDDCPSSKGFAWGVTKSQEITSCDLEGCIKPDEKYPNFRAKPKAKGSPPESPKKTKRTKDALQTNKDEEIEDMQNQLKEILLKNKMLLSMFASQLDELRAGYESAQKEMSRIKENREALNHDVERLKAEHELLDLQRKESEARKLDEMSELQKKADSDRRALRTCESNYDELKGECEYFKEKVAVLENQCVLLRQEIVDLKDALDETNRENKELQSCKLECDKMKDQCFQECKMLMEESKKKSTQLEDVQQERNDLMSQNSGLEDKIVDLSNEGLVIQEANAQLMEELEKARNDLRHFRNSVGGLTEDLSNLEGALAEKQREMRQLEDALEKNAQELEAANEERVKVENVYKSNLEEQKGCLEDALDELQTANDTNNRLARDLERLEDERDSLNSDLETWKRKYEGDVGDLQKNLEEAQEELGRAEAKLKENEEQLKETKSEYEHKLFEVINKYNISQRELQDHQEGQEMLQGKLTASLNQLENLKVEMSERKKEYEQERDEKDKLRSELNRSNNDFHSNQKSLEEALEALERAKQEKIDVENDLKMTICSYDCKINELVAARESTAGLKEEIHQATQENEKLKARLAEKDSDLDELRKTIASLKEDLRASKTEADKHDGKTEKFDSKCIPECTKRCAVKPVMKTQRARREECKKSCDKIMESQGEIKRPQVASPQLLNKECRDLCAELNSIKKMLSDIEVVSTSKPTMVMESSGSQLISPPEKVGVGKSSSWKEEYEKTAQERDELKQEISQMYNKLKEVMNELENKLNV